MRIGDRDQSDGCRIKSRGRNHPSRFRLRPQCLNLEDRLLLSGPGDLDLTFGDNDSGVAQVAFVPPFKMTAGSESIFGVGIDSAGNIVAAGYVDAVDGTDPDSPDIVAGESAGGSPRTGRVSGCEFQ
jgi:hypothetical protein